MHSCKAEDYYTDVIVPPQQRKVRNTPLVLKCFKVFLFYCKFHFLSINFQTVSNRETEVQTEDEQQFLARQQQVLMQGQTQTRGESPMRTPPSASKSMPRTTVMPLSIQNKHYSL